MAQTAGEQAHSQVLMDSAVSKGSKIQMDRLLPMEGLIKAHGLDPPCQNYQQCEIILHPVS